MPILVHLKDILLAKFLRTIAVIKNVEYNWDVDKRTHKLTRIIVIYIFRYHLKEPDIDMGANVVMDFNHDLYLVSALAT